MDIEDRDQLTNDAPDFIREIDAICRANLCQTLKEARNDNAGSYWGHRGPWVSSSLIVSMMVDAYRAGTEDPAMAGKMENAVADLNAGKFWTAEDAEV